MRVSSSFHPYGSPPIKSTLHYFVSLLRMGSARSWSLNASAFIISQMQVAAPVRRYSSEVIINPLHPLLAWPECRLNASVQLYVALHIEYTRVEAGGIAKPRAELCTFIKLNMQGQPDFFAGCFTCSLRSRLRYDVLACC